LRDWAKSHSAKSHVAASPLVVTTPVIESVALHDAPPMPTPTPADDPCNKRLFVRADPIDNSFYAVTTGAADQAKGASVSYTDNRAASTQKAEVNGIISYVVFGGNACNETVIPVGTHAVTLTYAVAPWVSSSGTWNEPVTKTENEALKGGVDFQLKLFAPDFFNSQHFLIATPFDQTDFRGTAHASGVNLAYGPVFPDIHLGFSPYPLMNGYFDGYWEIRPEAEFRNVTSAGVTNLKVGDYDWYGGTVRGHLFLFTNPYGGSPSPYPAGFMGWPSLLANRISLIGTAQYYTNTISSTKSPAEIRKYSAEIQYKLSGCTTGDPSAGCQGADKVQGPNEPSTALSFEYDWGTDKDTLVFTQQYLVKLDFKY
jgi:hypothetical protein